MVRAIAHPKETLGMMGQVGKGAISQLAGKMGVKQDPAEKARTESLIRAIESHYGNEFGSWAGFKKSLASDPFGTLLDVATPFTLGEAALSRAPGIIGKAGKIAGKVSRTIDPVNVALGTAKKAGKAIAGVPTATQAAMSGTPKTVYDMAAKAGASADPALRESFLRFARGEGSGMEMVQAVKNAVTQARQDASNRYLQAKSGLSTATPSFNKVDSAVADARSKTAMHGAQMGQFKTANQALDEAEALINSYRADPRFHNVEGFDNLKQALWDLRGSYSGNSAAATALDNVYHGVRSSLVDADPQYAKLMDHYQMWRGAADDLEKSLLSGRGGSSAASLAKMMKSMKTPTGRNMLDEISKYDDRIPYMVAGHAVGPEMGSHFGIVDLALSGIHPGLAIGRYVLGSPHKMGMLNYGAGRAAGFVPSLLPKGVRTGAAAAGAAGAAAFRPGMDIATQAELEKGSEPQEPEETEEQKYQRIERAEAPDDTFGAMLNRESRNRQFDESGATIRSNKGAVGAAQIMPSTGPEAATLAGEKWDPVRFEKDMAYNVKLGRAYFENLKRIFGSTDLAVAAYNAGPARVKDALQKAAATGRSYFEFLPRETQDYLQAVVGRAAAAGGRIERASGGAVHKHEALIRQLMARVDMAKKAEEDHTEPLLQSPDESIVKALEVANRAI